MEGFYPEAAELLREKAFDALSKLGNLHQSL
jgi:hypothetical protein